MHTSTFGRWLVLLCMAIGFQLPSTLVAQYLPPPIQNYSANDYNGFSQIFGLTEDLRGCIYICTGRGVRMYDGTTWTRIETTNDSFLKSATTDKNGRVWIGGRGEFGYLDVDSLGAMYFVPLHEELAVEDQEFTEIWRIDEIGSAMFFHSPEQLIVYENGVFNVLKAKHSFHKQIAVNGMLFLRDHNNGLYQYKDGQLEMAPSGQEFADNVIYDMAPFKGDTLLAISPDWGLIYYNPNKYLVENTHWMPVKTELAAFLEVAIPYNIKLLRNGNYAIGTLSNGLVIMNRNGDMVDIIDNRSGLQNDRVWATHYTRSGMLWLGLHNGLTSVDVHTPTRTLTADNGFDYYVNGMVLDENTMYMATGSKIIRMKHDRASMRERLMDPVSAEGLNQFVALGHSMSFEFMRTGSHLLVAGADDVFEIIGDGVEVLSQMGARYFRESKVDTSIIYFFETEGLGYLQKTSDGRLEAHEFPIPDSIQLDGYHVIEVESDAYMEFWISNQEAVGSIVRLRYDENMSPDISVFDSTNGLPSAKVSILECEGEPVLSCGTFGIFEYDAENEKFNKNSYFDFRKSEPLLKGLPGLMGLIAATNSDLYAVTGDFAVRGIRHGDSISWDAHPFIGLNIGAMGFICELEPNKIWVSGPEGIAVYDPTLTNDYEIPYNTLISSVELKDETLFYGNFPNANNGYGTVQPASYVPVLEYVENNIAFHFAAPSFTRGNQLLYLYKLENFEDEWSTPSESQYKEYSNLDEGTYTFHVKAINEHRVEGSVASYTFTIVPPWYRTLVAYLAYIAGGILLMIVVVKLNSRRLIAQNLRLQEMVDEKTGEIIQQKNEIEAQRDDIAKQNKSMTDSIRYAKSLQDAILPASELIEDSFPKNMVFFRPRDIVSGDFYWFHSDEEHAFFAAVDCTGHGVPGALVSMTGSNLLQQIIVQREVADPGTILHELNIGVKSVFKRDGSLASANDGMDIALAVVDRKTKLIRYAGAHRSLLAIRDGEIIELKGDRTPIGGRTKTEFEFLTHEFQSQEGDMCYMFSDGYPDQFGGPTDRKFMMTRFKKLLIEISALPERDQVKRLQKELNDWQGNAARVDDILVVGFGF
jgi:serine phosphatase RsbU (regulator of sigma subunit)